MQDPRTPEQREQAIYAAAQARTNEKLTALDAARMREVAIAARDPKGPFWRRTGRTRIVVMPSGKRKTQILHATRGWKYA